MLHLEQDFFMVLFWEATLPSNKGLKLSLCYLFMVIINLTLELLIYQMLKFCWPSFWSAVSRASKNNDVIFTYLALILEWVLSHSIASNFGSYLPKIISKLIFLDSLYSSLLLLTFTVQRLYIKWHPSLMFC